MNVRFPQRHLDHVHRNRNQFLSERIRADLSICRRLREVDETFPSRMLGALHLQALPLLQAIVCKLFSHRHVRKAHLHHTNNLRSLFVLPPDSRTTP